MVPTKKLLYADLIKQKKEKEKKEKLAKNKEIKKKKEKEDSIEEYYSILDRHSNYNREYSQYLDNTKTVFLQECIVNIVKRALPKVTAEDKDNFIYTLANKFVKEQGTTKLLSKWRHQNVLLSELAGLVEKNYNAVLEASDKNNKDSWYIDDEIKDSFIDGLNNTNTDEAILTIINRVRDAETDFINDNSARKMEIENIMRDTAEKVSTAKNDAIKEEYEIIGKQKISNIRNLREKSIYQQVNESITKSAIIDPKLKNIYIEDGEINMDKIFEDANVLYTFLETLNTVEMADNEYIKAYINTL